MIITGHPEELSTIHGNCNSGTIDHFKTKAEKGVFPSEAVFCPDGIGFNRKERGIRRDEPVVLLRYDGMEKSNLGLPIFGNVEKIEEWLDDAMKKAGATYVKVHVENAE